MNKLLLLLLFVTYLLVSCNKETINYTQAEGTLIKPEVTIYQYGTHAIENNSEITFALKSDTIDLDAYINQSVIVKGHKIDGYPVDFGPDYLNIIEIYEQTPD